jgi:hypothetical protein
MAAGLKCIKSALLLLALALCRLTLCAEVPPLPPATKGPVDFIKDIQPILAKNCYSCHGPKKQKGSLRLDLRSSAMKTGEEQIIIPGKSAESPLVRLICGVVEDKVMPPDGDKLSVAHIGLIRAWIDSGAIWPQEKEENKLDWWSLRPIKKPPLPALNAADQAWVHSPIDSFVLAKLREKGLAPSPQADRRTLLRRVYLDLIGLPPTPEELEAFIADKSPDAYETIVDRLLTSPRYGERWARHWMDAVHFAETHGHDQDRIRQNAWPYRDYLIESFNRDTPYARFIQEQLAGDVIFPEEPQLTPALGFIAAGPWDESSLRDIREDSLCRQIGYYLDRDDMLSQTMATFTSSTVHCARCHDHKFDPFSQNDYYSLQAVFAGIGRADRAYDPDLSLQKRRKELQAHLRIVEQKHPDTLKPLLTPEVQKEISKWVEQNRGTIEWTTLELDSVQSKNNVVFERQPDHSWLATSPAPDTDTLTVTAQVKSNKITAIRLELLPDDSLPAKGPGRAENGNLHLSEFKVKAVPLINSGPESPVAIAKTAADFNQKDWVIAHAIDNMTKTAWGIYPEIGRRHWAVFEFKAPLGFNEGTRLTLVLEQLHGGKHIIGRFRLSFTTSADPAGRAVMQDLCSASYETLPAEQQLTVAAHFLKQKIDAQLAALPPPRFVYAGAADFKADGTHKPVSTPRPVHVLRRGDILKRGDVAQPGTLSCISDLKGRFELPNANDEGSRRAALAKWLSDPKNPLVWRSIVNRIWHYHFGSGIVGTPNDFGRMGMQPTHPELLDWLASNFLESGGSFKKLHRLIVTSAVYQQSSSWNATNAAKDQDNHFLWRMNRTRIDAECLHDSVLQISNRLDLTMGGPSVQQFVASPGVHVTPNVDYTKYDWNSAGAKRRSVYRFIFRTLPDPFMDALDCADASQLTAARNISVTPIQALVMLNDEFMLKHAEFLAQHLTAKSQDLKSQIRELYRLVLLREPNAAEAVALESFASRRGLENACRLLLNCSEFMFVD